MPTNWNEIAKQAGKATDEQFAKQIAGLTRLNDTEIEQLIFHTGISQKDLAEILLIIKDTTRGNEAKVKALKGISKGVEVLVEIAEKLL